MAGQITLSVKEVIQYRLTFVSNTNRIDFLSKTTFVKSSELCCKTIFRSNGLVGCMK